MTYSLWDTQTSSLVGEYDSEEAVILVLKRALERHGPEPMLTVALGFTDDSGEIREVAEGEGLIEMLQQRQLIAHSS